MDRGLRRVVQEAIVALRQAGIEEPEREGYRLLAVALNSTAEALWRNPPSALAPEEVGRLQALITRRIQGEPFAYLAGYREFYGLTLFTPPGVLIPRPETEHLVEAVLAASRQREGLVVVDVGCGSGAIALSLRQARPDWRILATDVKCWPLMVTAINSYRLNLPVALMRADLLTWPAGLAGAVSWADGPIDLICANLPYIGVEEAHRMSVETRFEPPEALFAADHGMAILESLIGQAPGRLSQEGGLFLEVGDRQAYAVAQSMRRQGFSRVETIRDFSGRERVVYGWWRRRTR